MSDADCIGPEFLSIEALSGSRRSFRKVLAANAKALSRTRMMCALPLILDRLAWQNTAFVGFRCSVAVHSAFALAGRLSICSHSKKAAVFRVGTF
jgi:hypothetical protein